MGNEVVENMGHMVRERESIERKLSSTYSLGRDRPGLQPKSLLPLYDGKTRSLSFQGVFHTLSDTSSEDSSSSSSSFNEDKDSAFKGKGKAPIIEVGSSSDETDYQTSSPSESASGSKGFINPLFMDPVTSEEPEITKEIVQNSGCKITRRRTLSSTS